MGELARIQKVDVREAWINEAADFTPWLQENIDQLGDALGMDLEVQEREAPVGSFSLDLLARDGNGRPVIIENQLDATNHSHLGQILTYAGGYDARVIVWIAKDFRDEHRAALDFLNSRTGDDTEFFGVTVALWKIDQSRPAVYFDLVVTPNEWRKQAAGRSGGSGPSERNEKYRQFFQPLMDELRDKHAFTRARKAQAQPWYSFSTGTAKLSYSAVFGGHGRVRVELYISFPERDRNKQTFDRLQQQRDAIESELESKLKWERLNNRKASRISLSHPGLIDDDEERLEEIREWMISQLLAFKRAFGPRLADVVN